MRGPSRECMLRYGRPNLESLQNSLPGCTIPLRRPRRLRAGTGRQCRRRSSNIICHQWYYHIHSLHGFGHSVAIRASTTPTRCSRGIGSTALGCEVNRCSFEPTEHEPAEHRGSVALGAAHVELRTRLVTSARKSIIRSQTVDAPFRCQLNHRSWKALL